MKWCALFVALVVGHVADARGESPAAVPASSRTRIRVRMVGALARDATLRARIQSWFDPNEYDVLLQEATYLDPNQVLSPESGMRVEAWITERSSGSLRLYFASVDAKTRKARYLLRDLALERGLDEVASEELAQAVHLSASALVEGELMTAREQVEESLREQAPVPEPVVSTRPLRVASVHRESPAFVLHGALGYAVALRGDEGLAQGPRVRASLGGAHLGGLVRLNVVVPHQAERTELDLKLSGGAGLVALTYGAAVTPKLRLDAFAGPALELLRYRAVAHAGSAFQAAESATELRPQIAVGALVGFGSSPRVVLVPQIEVALKDTHYDVARGPLREAVARASRFTPSFGLELEL